MWENRPLLFYYPSTWAFVDDQEQFLSAIELALPVNQPYGLWSDPIQAVAALTSDTDLFGKELGLPPPHSFLSDEDVVLRFELDRITRMSSNPNRYSRVGVVVADYAMPGTTGLELLRKLQSQQLGKVLLTGVADEKVAVAAFNDGLIDRFVLKSYPEAMAQTIAYCRDLERETFYRAQAHLIQALPDAIREIFNTEEVTNLLERLLHDGDICEYYFSSKPTGFFCLNHSGDTSFLVIIGPEYLKSQLVTLGQFPDTPVSVLDRLSSLESVEGLFEEVSKENVREYDWEFNSVALNNLTGTTLLWGVHSNPPVDVDFDSTSCSLDAYIAGVQSSLS